MFLKYSNRFILLVLLLTLSGCATVALKSELGSLSQGLRYYLPKTTFDVVIKQKYLKKGWNEIKARDFFRLVKLNAQGLAAQNPNATWDCLKCKKEKLPITMLRVEGISVQDLNNSEKIANATFLAFATKDSHVSYELDITNNTLQDPLQAYTLTHDASISHDERLCVVTNTNQLLQSVEYAGDDRLPQILYNVTRTFRSLFPTATEQTPELSEATPGIDPRSPQDRVVKAKIDFTNIEFNEATGELELIDVTDLERMMDVKFKTDLNYDPARFNLGYKGVLLMAAVKEKLYKACGKDKRCIKRKLSEQLKARCDQDSICYRNKLKIPFELRTANGALIDSKSEEIINAFDMSSISVKRAFLVEKVSRFQFHNGILTGVAIRKPSELEAATLLPINFISGLLSTPVGLLSQLFHRDAQTQARLVDEIKNRQDLAKAFREDQAATVGSTQHEDKSFKINCTATLDVK